MALTGATAVGVAYYTARLSSALSEAVNSAHPGDEDDSDQSKICPVPHVASTPPGGPDDEGDEDSGEISFGVNANQSYHAFRHVEAAGLDRNVVESAIRRDLTRARGSIGYGHYNGSVTVEGIKIDYAAFRLANGRINVGRITPPRT